MSSKPSSPRLPAPTLADREDVPKVKPNSLHLHLAPFELERLRGYASGGHHPVHLGDAYGDNGRYRVIHKLGHGGFATVWLSRDTEAGDATKYVALKILTAAMSGDDCPKLRLNQLKAAHDQHASKDDGADSICFPLEHFKIHGPNGDHLAFVYPVLGPTVTRGFFRASADPDSDLRSICLQVVKAVQFIHSQGICHGDITSNNVLHRTSELDGLNEDEVLQILGSPFKNPVLTRSKECHDNPTAPQYLVYPAKWWDARSRFMRKESCLIDFGESFETSQPPDDLGIPGPYRSPELILDRKAGLGSDLWALGCTLFEIRTGRKLFDAFDDDDDEYLYGMLKILGKLPEPWWSTTWKNRRRVYKDEVVEQEPAVSTVEPESRKGDPEKKRYTVRIHPSIVTDAGSLQDTLAYGVWYLTERPEGGDGEHHRNISQTEQELFADLLGRLLQYKPEDRISAEEAMNHEWFKL